MCVFVDACLGAAENSSLGHRFLPAWLEAQSWPDEESEICHANTEWSNQ